MQTQGRAARTGLALRDLGPYSARNSSKGALIPEAGRVVEGLASGLSIANLRAKALEGSLFAQRARSTRERIWDALHQRYFGSLPGWALGDLQTTYATASPSREFVSLLYLHYALRDRLTYDFVTEILWKMWRDHQLTASQTELFYLLDRAEEMEPKIRRWTEATRHKLAQSILAALRDFGLLEGKQSKRITQPVLPLSTTEHLLRLLTAEGVRGADVLRDPTWRLFLCRERDVANHLHQLAQNGRIRFERIGDTVVLSTPDTWSAMP